MLLASNQFTQDSQAKMRPIYWSAMISFFKNLIPTIDFFTIGVSSIGGSDLIKGTGDVVQEWDKYVYDDYSSRIIGFDITRENDKFLGGSILSMADVYINNYDDYFTPGKGSAISDFILPYRPIRLYSGFRNEALQNFIGVTEKMPEIDDRSKTVSFHCIDFLQQIFNKSLDEAVIYQNKRVDEIIASILEDIVGLATSQYNLDVASVTIPFCFFEKGSTVGDIFRKLCQADIGNLFLNEDGVIRYEGRNSNISLTSVFHFDESNILELKTKEQDEVINVVEVISNVRTVLANQKFWEMSLPVVVPAGGTAEIWADFTDPVTTVDTPVYVTSATTSLYTTNLNEDGSGATGDANITVQSISNFSTSSKVVFANSGGVPVYITTLELWARPAKVTNQIYIRETDENSILKYGELVHKIENDYIQDESTAISIAKVIIGDNSEYGEIVEIEVRGLPQLQIGDKVDISYGVKSGQYTIEKIITKLRDNALIQVLTLTDREPRQYFRIGISSIGGTDQIGL